MASLFNIIDSASSLYHAVIKPQPVNDEAQLLYDEIEKARSDLERAEALFNETTNSAISDYAAYNILAHKARYSYLINLAKEQKLHS